MNSDLEIFELIRLDKQLKQPLYVQLYTHLQKLICTRQLAGGYLLPPVRKLAALLNINAGTVVSAYRKLEQNGYIYSKGGSGNYVAELASTTALTDFKQAIPDTASSEEYINLASISLNPELISIAAIKNVLIEVLNRDQGYAFSYQDSQGFLPLRQSIAATLKASNIQVKADNVQIISGAQQGIDLAAKALLNYGDYVFVEAPTYPGALAAFRSRGAKIIPIPLTETGLDLQVLENKLRLFQPKLIYLMPNVQNPTGITYSVETRNRLMGLARYYNITILEDDYISDLHYSPEAMAPLKALDRDDRIIYLKSFSKIFMPGLRLAFLITPPLLTESLAAAKRTADIATSALTQRAFDLYLRKGIWQDHLHTICHLYKERFNITLEALQANLPARVKYTVPMGGMSFWLELPPKISAANIVQQAYQQKLLLTAGNDFFISTAADSFIRLSFATASTQEIRQGIQILSQLIHAKL